MKSFDPESAVKDAARRPWYSFLVPKPFPPFENKASLETANWYASMYSKEVRNLQLGRAFWAWVSVFLAVVCIVGLLT